jgi:esterase/lipase superfamily enzyme
MARVGYDEVFARTNAIVLIDPDIEIDVFRHQARPVVARGVPIFIIVSTRDRALLASALIRGERQRLGSIRSTSELGIEDVMVINISDVEDPGFTDHFAVATSPELLAFIRSLRGQGLEELQQRAGPADAGVAILQEGAKLVLSPLTGGQ